MNKVVIVGVGNVGREYSFSVINQKTSIDELILIDASRGKVLGEYYDLSQANALTESNTKLKVGTYDDCKDAKIVIITAGANQRKGETRLDLVNKNAKIVKEITKNVISSGFKGIFLVATNPVDIMTYVVRKTSNFSSNRVIGSGTALDTIRLRYYLSQKFEINPRNIDAYVLGEHGDSSFVLWSKAHTGIISISSILSLEDKNLIEENVRRSAYKIINYKGETSFAIAEVLLKLTECILDDLNMVYTVSSPVDDIYIGMPSVINKDGIKGVMKFSLSKEEEEKLNLSKQIITNTIENMEE